MNNNNYSCKLCNKTFSTAFNLLTHTNNNSCTNNKNNLHTLYNINNNQQLLLALNKDFWKNTFITWNQLLDNKNTNKQFGAKQLINTLNINQNLDTTQITNIISQLITYINPKYLKQNLNTYIINSNILNINTKTLTLHTIHKLKLFLNYNLTYTNRIFNNNKITTLINKL